MGVWGKERAQEIRKQFKINKRSLEVFVSKTISDERIEEIVKEIQTSVEEKDPDGARELMKRILKSVCVQDLLERGAQQII